MVTRADKDPRIRAIKILFFSVTCVPDDKLFVVINFISPVLLI